MKYIYETLVWYFLHVLIVVYRFCLQYQDFLIIQLSKRFLYYFHKLLVSPEKKKKIMSDL